MNSKGSFALYGHGNFDLGDPAAITEAAEISEKSLDYFEKIISLCREEVIPLILVKTPTVDLKKYQPYCNAVDQIAAREGLPFYNFNEMGAETGITGEDFYFDTHLNLTGARKLSRSLAGILLDTVELTDHRGDSAFASWDVNAENINDGYLLSITEAADYITELQRGGRAVLLIQNGDWENREPYLGFVKELSKLGVSEEELLEKGSGAWLIDQAAGQVSRKGLAFTVDGKDYAVDFAQAAVTENGSIVYTFRDLGITLLVYDYGCGKLLDSVDFLHSGYFELDRK